MSTSYQVLLEEFCEELGALSTLVSAAGDPQLGSPAVRVAGANAAVLLLAATFEEFVREMARAYARDVVAKTAVFARLPTKLASTAWRRTLETLARADPNKRSDGLTKESILAEAQAKFSALYAFSRGDLSQEIYSDLIHNENNMRAGEVNKLFGISGLKNVCERVCSSDDVKHHFGEEEPSVVSGMLNAALEEFFDRRNQIAHSIRAMRSSSPITIENDIALFRCFGTALRTAVETSLSPEPNVTEPAA